MRRGPEGQNTLISAQLPRGSVYLACHRSFSLPLRCSTPNRDRGRPRSLSPPTPPDRRGTSPAVRPMGSTARALRPSGHPEAVEVPAGERRGQRRTAAYPPRSVGRLGRVPGQVTADPAVPELPGAPSPPLLPAGASQAPSHPGVQLLA